MTLRHLAPAPLLAVAILACTPSVPSNPNTEIVTAEFDPATGTIPLPNSLAISPDLNPNILAPRNAQEELLGYFARQGGFPPDQVLPLVFPIATLTVNGPNDVTPTAPDIDLASIVPCTGQQAPGNCNLFVFDALAPADEAVSPPTASPTPRARRAASLSVTPGTDHGHHLAPGRPLLLRAPRRRERDQDHDRGPAAALLHHLHAHLRAARATSPAPPPAPTAR